MRRIIKVFSMNFALISAIFLSGCGGAGSTSTGTPPPSSPAETYEFWRGDIPNSYYVLNLYGERGLQVTGKPWMVLKRDGITLQVVDCEFGLSEVTQTSISTPSGLAAPPEPTLAATAIDYYSKLQLDTTKPVTLCVGWGSKSTIVNGVQTFSFTLGSSPGGVGYNEGWSFSYLSLTMWGDVKNIDTTYYLGIDSDSKAFSLMKL